MSVFDEHSKIDNGYAWTAQLKAVYWVKFSIRKNSASDKILTSKEQCEY